jgi:hypothetical protein
MENEGPVHAERSTEKAGFEDDIVARRGLTGSSRRRYAWARGRPVVAREHECGKADFMRKLDEAREGGCPWIEGRRPGIDIAQGLSILLYVIGVVLAYLSIHNVTQFERDGSRNS